MRARMAAKVGFDAGCAISTILTSASRGGEFVCGISNPQNWPERTLCAYLRVSRQPAASASSTEQNQRVPLLICILIWEYQRLVVV